MSDEQQREPVDISVPALLSGLANDARGIDEASRRLTQQIKKFEGAAGFEIGVKLRWEVQVDRAFMAIQEEIEEAARDPENKLPAQLKSPSSKVIEARARDRARSENMDLWLEYEEMEAEIKALGKWLAARERSSSLRQTILNAQRQDHNIQSSRER